jgi:cytochrome P450
VFPLIARVLQRPTAIGGWELPRGTLVYISIDLAHRNPRLWPDADRFDPNRFLDARPRPFAYFPFGGGSRRCIGMSYALYEMRVIVAEALRRFRIVAAGAPEPATTRGFTLAPAKGAVVRLVPR